MIKYDTGKSLDLFKVINIDNSLLDNKEQKAKPLYSFKNKANYIFVFWFHKSGYTKDDIN